MPREQIKHTPDNDKSPIILAGSFVINDKYIGHFSESGGSVHSGGVCPKINSFFNTRYYLLTNRLPSDKTAITKQ
jgi:hypothetical protein